MYIDTFINIISSKHKSVLLLNKYQLMEKHLEPTGVLCKLCKIISSESTNPVEFG